MSPTDMQTLKRGSPEYPQLVEQRLHEPPPELYVRGANLADLLTRKVVAIVGTRRISPYGREITSRLAQQLSAQGVVIVSGLALGVDACAHQACLDAGGLTIAVLPSPVDKPLPKSNAGLARNIVKQGGALVSMYPPNRPSYKEDFVERNQLVTALSQVLVVTEAAEQSGTLSTVNFANQMGVEVLAVPGNITSPVSAGTNQLLKTGAEFVTDYTDILAKLGLPKPQARQAKRPFSHDPAEQTMLNLLFDGVSDGNELMLKSGLTAAEYGQALTMLEITGRVRALGANNWSLS